MHIAWLGKKSPFCGNVTYSREVTNALLDRDYQVSFIHFAQENLDLDKKTIWGVVKGETPLNVNSSLAFNSVTKSAPDKQVNSLVSKSPTTLVESQNAVAREVYIPCLYKSQIYTIPTLRSQKVLEKSLKQLKPDIIHASLTLSPLDFVLPEICEKLNLPLVATFHPAFDRKLRNLTSGTQHLTYQLYAPFLANYDRVIVFSNLQRDLLAKLGVAEEKVAVIPNGVDADKYSPGTSDLKAKLKADRIFVYQGRIAPEKNVEALLKAWKQAEMGPQSKLVIVGDGPLAASLQMFYGEDDGIVWLGFIAEDEQRIEILRGSDVFILPSLVEGLSLSLLEGMACGLACLATDAGADGEVLENGAGVVLNTQRASSQLRTLLPLFQDHPEMADLLGQKGRQRVLDRYTLSQNITNLEKLYGEVLQEREIKLNLI
jgi:glycosyltransferase involved in cell wall biosynthesis